MSCFVPYDSLQETLLTAYRTDFNKYKDLSEVINSVMTTSLSPEAKIHAVWFYSGFVDTMALRIPELQTEQWSNGTYRKLHNYLKLFLTGDQEFDYDTIVDRIKEFFPKAPAPAAPAVPVSDLQARRDALEKKGITIMELNGTYDIAHNEDGIIGEYIPDLETAIKDAERMFEKFYSAEKPESNIETDERTLTEKIEDDISDVSSIIDADLISHVNGIINTIMENASELNDAILDPQNTVVGNMLMSLRDAVSARQNSPIKTTVLENINYNINNLVKSAEEGSVYFNLAATVGIGVYNNEPIKIITKRSGERIEVVYDGNKKAFVYWSPNTPLHLTQYTEEVTDHSTNVFPNKVNALVTHPKTGAIRLQPDQVFTGVFIPYENDKVQGERAAAISENAPVGAPFQSSVTVHAHTNTVKLNAARMERLRKEYPSLNRGFETMETPRQRELLGQGKGPFITFYRPTSGFTIRVSDINGDNAFDLDTLANLAIVYPDNTVVPFDINNEDHVNILRNETQTRIGVFESTGSSMDYYKRMTDEEFEQLKESLLRYQEFEREVMDRMEQENSDDVDIKDIFNKYYNLSNNIESSELLPEVKPVMSLREFIEENAGALPVMLQNVDEKGKPTGDPYSSRIHIVLRKENGIWKFEQSILPENVVIVGKDNTRYKTISEYLKSENVDYATQIANNFGTNQAVYISFQYSGNRLNPRIIPLMYDKRVRDGRDAVDFASSLVYSLLSSSMEKDNTATKTLNNDLWGFDQMDNIRPQFTILKQVGDNKTYGIKFFALPILSTISPEIANLFETKVADKYSIELNKDLLNDIFINLKDIQIEAGIAIPPNSSVMDIRKLSIEAASILGKDHPLVKKTESLIQDLSSDIKRKYSQMISRHDADVLDGNLALPLFTKNFSRFSLFDGNIMKIKSRMLKPNMLDAYDRLETKDTKRLTVTPNVSSTRILSSLPEVISKPLEEMPYSAPVTVPVKPQRAPVVNPETVKVPSNQSKNLNEISDDPGNNNTPFSLVEGLEAFFSLTAEQHSSEIQTMKEFMPSAFTFIGKPLNGLDVDGFVLGYVEDLFIYLDSNLRAKGVAYHEGFHAIFRRLLTQEQQNYYLLKAEESLGGYKTDDKGKYIMVRGTKVYANEFRERRRYGHLNDDQIRFLIYEEYLADSFADFMETNKAPRTWMQKLFAYLKKLLNLFKKGGRVENLFYDISLGKFRNAPILDYQGSNMEKVYSLDFRGFPVAYVETNGKIVAKNQMINSSTVVEVRDFLLQGMSAIDAQSPGSIKAKDLFEMARKELIKQYDINTLIAKHPGLSDQIEQTLGDEWATARWLLGSLLENEKFTYKNLTKDPEYDNQTVNSKSQTEIVMANVKSLRSMVIDEFKSLDDLQDIVDDENMDEVSTKDDTDVEIKDSFYEGAGFVGVAPSEGNAAFRKLLRLITYEETHPILGIKIRKMVDSSLIFSTITKITSSQVKGNGIKAIYEKIEELDIELDHFRKNIQPNLPNPARLPVSYYKTMKLRDSLKAVYNTLDKIVGFNSDFEATRNDHILKQFAMVFGKVDAHLLQADVTLQMEYNEETRKKEQVGSPASAVSDIVVLHDINKIRESVKDSINAIRMNSNEAEIHLNKLKSLALYFNQNDPSAIDNIMDNFFQDDGYTFNDAAFREFVDDIYLSIAAFNIDIPYSTLYTSLGFMVYEAVENDPDMFPENGDMRKTLRSNKQFFSSFRSINNSIWYKALPQAIETSLNTSGESKERMSSNTLNTMLKRFTTPYVIAFGEMIIKNDPTIAGSSTKNANGDTVYKYVDPNKELLLTQKLHAYETVEEGLAEILNDDFAHFYENNPMLDLSNPEVKAFFENLDMGVYAGFQLRHADGQNGMIMGDPRTFKDIDDASFMLSMLSLFLSQKKIYVPKTESYITTFKRIFTVYEATGTSMVTDGLLKRYFNNQTGDYIPDNGYPKYVWDLLNVLKQEYELIRTNYEIYDDPNTKKLLNYNVNPNDIVDSAGAVVKERDRGFRFNVLSDFANDNGNISKELVLAAKEGVPFDSLMQASSEGDLSKNILDALWAYSRNQYLTFENKFEELGLQMSDIPLYVTDVYDEDAQQFLTARPITVLREFFFNTWINSLTLNQVYDGPLAVGVKNAADYFKRQKAGAAAGPSLYNPHVNKYGITKTYRAAVIAEVVMYLDNSDFTKPARFTPYYEGKDSRNVAVKVADGQSYNTVSRIIDVNDSRGRVDNEAYQILKRMMFETKDTKEYASGVRKLNKKGVVFNSLKTVTAGRMEYIKQSEHTLIRKDVSTLKEGLDYDQAMAELDVLYDRIMDYAYRLKAGKNDEILHPDTNVPTLVSDLYKEMVSKAHGYFDAIPHHAFMHHMLNSMEYHMIDHMFDPNASKKMTPNPVKVELEPSVTGTTYYNLDQALMDVPKELTFIQVPTEKDATMVTQGIQQKLLIIANLTENDPEYQEIAQDIKAYKEGLSSMVKNQLKVLKRMFNTNDAQVVTKIYQVISAGLKEQGADSTILQYFEVDQKTGNPRYNPNLPVIQGTIAYYFFSIFNNNLFDKKIAGRKYYHISPLGYNVMEMDGKVVTTQEYKKNKATYDKALASGKAEVRSLKYNKVKNKDGSYTYHVEVIVPKELRNVDQEFLEKYLSDFFATRIPTEGKRSMVNAKVVDYIDEAYGSGIIVPSQVHLLAGSDFDIDAFYAHVRSSYRTPDSRRVLYGDYSYYKETYGMSEQEAKFMEYLIYMTKDPIFSPLLKSELKRIRFQTGYKEEQAKIFGSKFGGKLDAFFNKNAKLMEKEEGETDAETDGIETFKRLIAISNVIADWKRSNLPSTPEELEDYTKKENGSPVIPLIQNKILQAKMNILANEKVFNRFMQDPSNRADAASDVYKELIMERGKDESEIYKKQNLYSPTALIVARGLNSESKDSLGIAASFNKGVSMLVSIEGKLKNPIGKVYELNENNAPKLSVVTDSIIEDAVGLVGGYVGVSADAPKNPYPGPLHLNSHTVPVMLAMFAIGVPQRAAIMFQSIPIIQRLVSEYTKEYGSAYKRDLYKKDMSFIRFLEFTKDEMDSDQDLLNSLKQNEVLEWNPKTEQYELNKDSYKLTWTNDVRKDEEDTTEQPLSVFGFQLLDKDNVSLSKNVQDYIILNEFINYHHLSQSISFRITRLTDSLKSLKPDMDVFDRLTNGFDEMRTTANQTMWTDDTIKKLFIEYPVLRESHEALKYMDELSKKVLLERTSLIKGIAALLENMYGYESSDMRKDIKAFIALQLQRATAEKNPENLMNAMFLEQVNPEKFLNGDVIADYNQLKSRYPDNKFLQLLKPVDIGTTERPARVLEAIVSKISPETREMAYADLIRLLGEGYASETNEIGPDGKKIVVLDKERAYRIAYHAMVKAGAQKTRGGFFELIPAVLSAPMSRALDNLQKELVSLDVQIKQKYNLFSDLDGNLVVPVEAQKEYSSRLNQILTKNFDGMSVQDLLFNVTSKIISMKLADNTIKTYKQSSSVASMKYKYNIDTTVQEMIASYKKIAPLNASEIVNDSGIRVSKMELVFPMSAGEYELFSPKGNTVTFDLRGVTYKDELDTAILKSHGIRRYGTQFKFPMYKVNAYGQLLILKTLNNQPLSNAFMDTLYMTAFTNSSSLDLTGVTATYEIAPEQGSSKVSPLAFTSEEGAVMRNIINGLQQITDSKTIELPKSMTVVRSQNRMFELRTQPEPSANYLNTKMADILTFTTVQTTTEFSRFKIIRDELYQFVGNELKARRVKPEQLDLFAERVGMGSWQELSQSVKFKDFVDGKENLFLYTLNNADLTSPTAQPQVPTDTALNRALGFENPLIAAGVLPTDMYGNAAKDIQMAQEAIESKDGQFIGYKSGNAQISSTDRYRSAWATKANTGKYTADSVVMVSGSGTFRGVTAEQVQETFDTKYIPLLDRAIAAGASFRVGNRYDKGNLGDKLVADYLKKNGYQEEKLNGYSRWTKPQAPVVESTKPTIDLSREWRGDLESRPVYTAEGINTMRTSAAKPNEHFGNPFSEAGYAGTVKVGSIAEAVQAYKDWLLSPVERTIIKPDQRAWILDQINQGKLDGATLLYAAKSAARGQGMHPTALAEVVEELRGGQLKTSMTPATTQEETKLVDYKYYGKMYQIEVVNGVATKVVGYKGSKKGAEKKLLDAFTANPSVDPQSGKTFVKPITPSKTETPAPQLKYEYTFKDGFKVDVPFQLNAEQTAALEGLEDFYNDPKKQFITLTGAAGTGKSTVVSIFSKYLSNKYASVKYTAPTHRANAVTKMMNPKADVNTLHKLFGLGPEINFEAGNYDVKDLKFNVMNKEKIQSEDVLVIDESSMVNDALYEFIQDAAERLNLKVIYVGDVAQLKPVKQSTKSKVFDSSSQKVLSLTKVERTGENAVLAESVNVREGKGFSYSSKVNDSREGVVYLTSTPDTMTVAVTMLKRQMDLTNKLYFRILSATNKGVSTINDAMRKALFPENYEEQLLPGELIMGYSNFGLDYKSGEYKLYNGGDYEVMSVSRGTKTIKQVAHTYSGYNVTLRNVLDIKDKPINVFVIDNNESVQKVEDFANAIQQLRMEGAKLMKQGERQRAAALFDQSSKLEAEMVVMQDFEKIDPIDKKVKTIMRKTFDYGYAHTIHKSQGGTYNNVLILDDTIGAPFDTETQKQLRYVAVSRASKLAFVRTSQSSAMSQENKAFNITKLSREIDEVIRQKEEESRNCNQG